MADDRGARAGGRRRAALPRKPLCLNRDPELRKVRELRDNAASAGEPLLLAVSGGNGIGKSTLIVTVAYELGAAYRDVLYAAVDAPRPGAGPDWADLWADLLVQLGVPWQELPEPNLRLSVLRSLVGGSPLLIVLDDVRSAEQVLSLLGDLHNAAVVVAGERQLQRLRIEGFEPLKLAGFGPDAGAEYLSTLAGPAVAGCDRALLRRLVELCGGVPRLIGAAAARLADGDEPVEDYVNRLERAHTLDEVSEDLSIDSESVVNAVCEAGYEGLTDDEAVAYRGLSGYPGSAFDVEAAAAHLDVSVSKAKRLIRELVDRSLLQTRGTTQFEYPHVIRPHAIAKAADADTPSDVEKRTRRTVEWCTHRAAALALSISQRPIAAEDARRMFEQNERRYGGDGVESAYTEFAARWKSFVDTAWRALELGMLSEAVALAIALCPFAYQTYRCSELIDLYRDLWDAVTDERSGGMVCADAGCRWQVARDLGTLHERRGELAEASEWFERAATVDYPPGRASVLEWRGIVTAQQDRPEAALSLYAAAQAELEWVADPAQRERSAALLHMHRARTLAALGWREQAESETLAAASYFDTRPSDANNAARCRDLLGDIARQRGDNALARRHWEEALEVLSRLRMRREVAAVHGKLADLAEQEGRTADARRHREQQQPGRPETG